MYHKIFEAQLLLLYFVSGIKVVANAGGINPEGCAASLKQVLGEKSKDLKIAVVTGDNLIDRVGFGTVTPLL